MESLKILLMTHCRQVLQDRAQHAISAIAALREAAAQDTKSSAGDKFETAREMIQQDMDRHKALLQTSQDQLNLLDRIRTDVAPGIVVPGSLVHTSQGAYFLAVSAGSYKDGAMVYHTVSSAAPLGRLLLGQMAGNAVELNGKKIRIDAVH